MSFENDSSSQDFYSRTVAALDRKDASDQEVAQKLQAVKDAAKAQNPDSVAAPQKPIAVEPEDNKATDTDVPLASEVGGSDKGTASTTGEGRKSVAGRKTIKGGESKDVHSGKEAPKYPDPSKEKEGEETEEKKKTEEEHDIETELNAILKKGPSVSFRLADGCMVLANDTSTSSNNLQQILLPLLRKSQTHTTRKVHYRPCSICRRARPTSLGSRVAGCIGKEHGKADGPEHTGQWQKYWRWGRYRGFG